MRNNLNKWMYKYTNVFNEELKAASVDPFTLELKPDANWEEAAYLHVGKCWPNERSSPIHQVSFKA